MKQSALMMKVRTLALDVIIKHYLFYNVSTSRLISQLQAVYSLYGGLREAIYPRDECLARPGDTPALNSLRNG